MPDHKASDELTLITVASEQVWPNINAILHYRPTHLILLHTADEKRSAKPARRLRSFCIGNDLVDTGRITLLEIPSDSLGGILGKLAQIQTERDLKGENSIVNLTGGTKYMGVALYTFALFKNSIPCIYFEMERIYMLSKEGKGITQHPVATLPRDLVDHLDPHEIARCQGGDAVIEDPGQLLTLQARWLKPSRDRSHFVDTLENKNFHLVFDKWEEPEPYEDGFDLEFQVAALLLFEGVQKVRRSFRLRVPHPGGREGSSDQEIDLMFNHGGQRLYFVECKDRNVDVYNKLELLRAKALKSPKAKSRSLNTAYEIVHQALQTNRTAKFKEDLFHSARLSGLTAKTIWVMRKPPGRHESDFCKLEAIDVILSGNMAEEIAQLPCFGKR